MADSNRAGQDEPETGIGRSGFVRLAELLTGIEPCLPPINLSIGEPRHPLPKFLGPTLQRHLEDFGRYPATRGTEPFRTAVANWLGRRYSLARPVDPEREVIVLAGSREGLFLAALTARRYTQNRGDRPAILLPNPLYLTYFSAARATGCEPFPLPATRATGFVPDYDAVPDELLRRTVAIYLCSPGNPQGAVLSRDALARIVERARAAGAMIFADECYSEIWLGEAAPTGILEVAGNSFEGVVAFNSLSKRSSMPGLRCGFAAGDPDFLAAFSEFRNVAACQVPMPVQHVAIEAYGDEKHVEETRNLYRAKFDLADRMLAGRYNYRRPDGGFFLWLEVEGDDVHAAREFWRRSGLRVVPGSYLGRTNADGTNPGAGFIRAALIADLPTTEQALRRLAEH